MPQHRILIVENDRKFRETLKDCLLIAGFSVTESETRIQGESLARQKRYSAIIMDVRLNNDEDVQDWSGLISARHLSKNKTPIIILSAFDKREDVDRAYGVARGTALPEAFISKNDPNWGEKIIGTLNELLQPQMGFRFWISQNWEKLFDFVLKIASKLSKT